MDEKEISSISLDSLLKIYPPQEEDFYYEGAIFGQRTIDEDHIVIDLFRFPTRINAFGAVFCSKGSINITSDLRHCTIGPRMLFVCPPGTIIQVEFQNDAAIIFILCDENFINRIQIDLKQLLRLFLSVREKPYLTLSDLEWQELSQTIDAVLSEGHRGRKDPLSLEILHTLLRGLAYRICRVIDDQLGQRPDNGASKDPTRDRSAYYFNLFLEELTKNYMQERSVGFYAERLHLTPKYLTTLLRISTGRTASEWIDEYVILEAKNLLKYSPMNIQEVAYYLNFPNQSFFGRYFKQHTGMTPSAYRSSK